MKRLTLFLGICLLVILTSCKDFLNGADVKALIEESIAYANAPSYKITIDFPESCGVIRSTDGNKFNKKVTDSFDIWFDPFTGYEFICWKIIDSSTNKEIKNGEYLTLETFDRGQTSCHFTKAPSSGINLCLTPVVAERPQIIFNSPVTLSALKDASILVLFDHDMDSKSIYFTESEINTLKQSGIADEDFLPPLENNSTEHYGYKKDGNVFFKNIRIKNEKTAESLNACFDKPRFINPRTLSISVKDKNALDDFTQVHVAIEKSFFYTQTYEGHPNGKPVEMADSKRWLYQVNNKTDTKSLVIGNSGGQKLFSVKLSDGSELKPINFYEIQDTGEEIKNLQFVNDKKLHLILQVQEQEGGSGPAAYFEVYATKLFDESYTDTRVWDGVGYDPVFPVYYEEPYNVDYTILTSDTGIFDDFIDLSNMNLDGDGVYQLYFCFYDKSGNRLEYPDWINGTPYFFAVDNQFFMDEPLISDVSDSDSKLRVSWSPCKDFAKTVIRYKCVGGEFSEPVTILRDKTFTDITGLESDTDYEFEIDFYDYAGNSKKYKKSAKTSDWGIIIEGTPDKTLYFENEEFDRTGLIVKLANMHNGMTTVEVINDFETDFDTIQPGKDKTVSVKYTYKGSTKYVNIKTLYNIVAPDALTQKTVKLDEARYLFGDFPQKTAEIQKFSYYSDEPVYNNWYLGDDGYFYEKKSGYNGSCYFRVEPIKWMYTDSDENGTKILVADTILTAGIAFYDFGKDIRNINETTIYPNNYKYSTLRAYLNGSYEDEDTQPKIYENDGFLQKAFTPSAQNLIVRTTVDNSKDSIPVLSDGNEQCISPDTNDKVFVLSANELYYMMRNNSELYKQWGKLTDYNKQISGTNMWWLRSPLISKNTPQGLSVYMYNSKSLDDAPTDSNGIGIVPAIVVSESELPD